jgi:predicted nucleic acid-binding protein
VLVTTSYVYLSKQKLNHMTLNQLKQKVLLEQIEIFKQVEEDEEIDMSSEIELLEEEVQSCITVQGVRNLLTERGYSLQDAYEIIIKYSIE